VQLCRSIHVRFAAVVRSRNTWHFVQHQHVYSTSKSSVSLYMPDHPGRNITTFTPRDDVATIDAVPLMQVIKQASWRVVEPCSWLRLSCSRQGPLLRTVSTAMAPAVSAAPTSPRSRAAPTHWISKCFYRYTIYMNCSMSISYLLETAARLLYWPTVVGMNGVGFERCDQVEAFLVYDAIAVRGVELCPEICS
jgi:hypothetical protein